MFNSVSVPRFLSRAGPLLNGLALVALPVLLFGVFLIIAGVNPVTTYQAMLKSTLSDAYGLGEVAVRAAPLVLAALATSVPARARLINVGGEGQLAVGALTTTALAVLLADRLPQWLTLLALALAGALGGAAWAGLAGVLRVKFKLNETIATLLFNYVAFLFLGYMVSGPLKDPASFNWPFSPPLVDTARFPTLPGTRVYLGILVAPVVAVVVWYVVSRTYWGLRLKVVGGNVEAARRAGINVGRVQLIAFLFGGALAGLAGMLQVAGVEGRLRPTTGVGFGYVGFLAAWMVSQHPLWLIASAVLLAVIGVSGDSLQISAGLPSSSVNVLMALVLLVVLARWRGDAR
jgi:general nucleoside transport system permease protein